MEWWLVGIMLFSGLLIILATGIPVAYGMGCLAMTGMFFLWGLDGMMALATTAYSTTVHFMLIAVPLFIFMGECIAVSGIGKDAFEMIDSWLGFLPGGIAVTSVGACTIFGAVTGFSPATCAALGPVAIPEMLRRGYDKGFSVGAIAAGAGLAIIIPPSTLMVIYGFLAEVSIGKLFLGGVVPGIVLSVIMMLSIVIRASVNPTLAPYRSRTTWPERFKKSLYIAPFGVLIILVLGSIWGGVATPTEGAALGATGGLILLGVYGELSWTTLRKILISTVSVNCMVMFILIGATLFTTLLAYTGFTEHLASWVTALPISKWFVLAFMMISIFLLGCVMDPGSILFITVPIFLPIINKLGFDPLWFGIVMLLNLEIATITPPVGMNLYVLKGITPPEVSLQDIIRGSAPYWVIDGIGLLVIIMIPSLATWLPNLLIHSS